MNIPLRYKIMSHCLTACVVVIIGLLLFTHQLLKGGIAVQSCGLLGC